MKSRSLMILALFAAVIMLAGCSGPRGNSSGNNGSGNSEGTAKRGTLDLSSFVAADIQGGAVSGRIFSSHKLNMVNIWATFCGPCIREMPEIQTLSEKISDLQVIGIVLDITDRNYNTIPDMKAEALKIIEQTGVKYLQILPSKSLDQLFLSGIQVVPVTLFVDSDGIILGEPWIGSRTGAEWESIIDSILKELK